MNRSVSITRSAYARLKGVDKSRVTRWIQAGLPLAKDGGINAVTADEWLRRNVDPTKRMYCHAARAYAGRSQQPPPDSPEADPVSAASRIVLTWLASRIPAAAAARALEAGFDRADVARIYELACAAAEEGVRNLVEELDLPCPLHDDWSKWRHPGFDPMPEAGVVADQPAPAGAVTV
jgi:hypothetical protein